MADQKLVERNIPGMNVRASRFAEVEHAENVSATLRRLSAYFAREKGLVAGMLAVVALGTVCGVYAPSLQSRAIDVIAGDRAGALGPILLVMLAAYLLYSAS